MATGTLTGQTIANTYKALLKITGTTAGGETLHATTQKVIEDGDGNPFPYSAAQDALLMVSTNRLEFGDTGTYINQSGDGILNITSDTEVEINATSVDLNGTLDVSGNAQLSGTVTVSADGTGTDVIFYSATTGDNFTWDASAECLIITGTDGAQALKVADGDLVVVDKLYLFDDDGGEYLSGDGTDLTITSGADIHLTATLDVNIPVNVGLRFGDGGENIETDNTSLTITAATVSALVLDANSRISLSNNDSGTSNTIFGKSAGASLDAGSNYNVFIGEEVSDATMNDATYNVGIGYQALTDLTTGDMNICIGGVAGENITTGSQNVLIGTSAGDGITGADNNVGIGQDALSSASLSSSGTVAIGTSALAALTSGTSNIAIGQNALIAQTDGTKNIAIGEDALKAMDAGEDENIAIGYLAGDSLNNASCVNNTLIGSEAGRGGTGAMADCVVVGRYAMKATAGNAQTGTVAIGSSALTALTSGVGNTALGFESLMAEDTGGANVALGYRALKSLDNTDGSNIAIGYEAMVNSANAYYNTVIGKGAGAEMGSANVGHCILIGYQAGDAINHADASTTIAIGGNTLTALTSGAQNLAVGFEAAASLTTGSYNTVLGYNAFSNATTLADQNTAIGRGAMSGAIVAEDLNFCVAVGDLALDGALDAAASGAVAIGASALGALTSGEKNTAIGYGAGKEHTTGGNNTIVGHGAMSQTGAVPASEHNTFIGANAGGGDWINAVSSQNTGIGSYCMQGAMNGGSYNTALGYNALYAVDCGISNVGIGRQAGLAINDGNWNTCLGASSGDRITTGNSNTCVGSGADTSASGSVSQIVIGNDVTGTGNSICTIGVSANTASLGLDGSDTSWAAASSDERYKENIETSTAGLSFVNDLRPVTYNWKKEKDVPSDMPNYKEGSDKAVLGHEYGTTLHGFIAQEVKSAIDGHSEIKEGFKMWKEKDDGVQTVADGNLVPMLVKAVQELSQQVEELKAKIN